MLQRNPYLLDSGIEKAYQTAVKPRQTERFPLTELNVYDNTARSMSSAGKILKNSRRTPKGTKDKGAELKASRVGSARPHQSLTHSQSGKRDRLHQLELRKCDLLAELRKIDAEMASLKEPNTVDSQKPPPEKPSAKKTAADLLKNLEAYAPPKQQLMTSIQKGRLLDLLRKHLDLQMELRTWKLKVPKEQEQQVNKVLQERHKLKEAEVVLQFDEFDPFVQADPATPAESLINNIYLHHSKCEEHWRNYLQGKFDKEEVKTLFSKLDFDKQGVVGLKQLVRELSILLDRHLRNRDLYRVFHRLTDDGQQFTCTQMLKVLGRK